MKLVFRIPLLFGVVVLVTSISIGIVSVQISSRTLEKAIIDAIQAETNASAIILNAKLTGQLDVLAEIATRVRVRTMEWGIVQQSLIPDVPRIGALDMAMATPAGISNYVIDNTSIEIGDRNYFKRAMAGEKNIEVVFSRLSSTIVVLFAVPIFQSDEPGAPVVGVLIARKSGGQTLSGLVSDMEISMESGHYFLVDNDGTFIAHQNTELVTNQFNPVTEAENNPALKSFADVITSALIQRSGNDHYTDEGKEMLCHYSEVPGYSWLLFGSIEKREIAGQLSQMRYAVAGISVIFLFAGLVFSVIIGRSISKPVAGVAGMLKDIAEGEGDLTRKIKINSNDEVGDLAKYFNETLEKIKNLVISIKSEASAMSITGGELASSMNQTAAAVNEIASNLQSLKSRIFNQSASVSETHATMENVTSTIGKLNDHIEKQHSNISQASSAIEQMVENTRSVTETLVKNSANVEALKEATEISRSGLHGVAEDIQGIARESEGLMQINAVMENIASQTNLLSMNAAIEAAHAGEAGRGFSVVAAEIRKLAESSGQQSKTISDVLKKIKESIDKITIATENVLNGFSAIDSGIKKVSEQEENIRSAMEEQGAGSKLILEGVSNINGITTEVREGSLEMLEGAQEVIKESENLELITHEITAGMNEMAIGTNEINLAVHHVNEISVKNRENIDLLIKEVSRFKIE